RVEAEFVYEPLALVGAARGADDAAAHQLGDLAGNRAGGASRTRNQNRFTRARFSHFEQTEIGGETGDAEYAQDVFGLVFPVVLAERACGDGGILLPAIVPADETDGPI